MLSALLFQEKSMHKETLEIYKKAMELYPNDNEIMADLAVFYLRIGKKLEGYELYNHIDFSKRINLFNHIDTTKISSDNNPLKAIQNLENLSKFHITSKKSYNILVFMEQGFGDVINFFRYLPYLQKMGHSITTIVSTRFYDSSS